MKHLIKAHLVRHMPNYNETAPPSRSLSILPN
jgi:hypothetical protein